MKWTQIPLGIMQTNCYIAEENGSCLIIDPGNEGNKLISWLSENNLKPLAILLTHAHFDHIGAVDEVREFFQIPVYVHVKEKDWLSDPTLNGSEQFRMARPVQAKPAEFVFTKEEEFKLGSFEFMILETPGHSPGSVSFYFEHEGAVISGDALFNGSIGRTDLREGNHTQLLNSIHEKLLTLPEETIVMPGHGPTTTVGDEMDHNPFLNGF
jgi:hydroxyacylglutathione hydrolase